MALKNGPLNLSTLDELTFRRSKWWSSFLEEIGEDDQTVVCDMDELDENYKDEFADEVGRNNTKEAEESDVLEDIEPHSMLGLMKEHERNSFMESSDVQDILNATRPILEEHDRKWKKAGLDRILNTFDSVRIEKEVGGWMRRNHSSTIANVEYEEHTDSSSSCDTERYIRSTRKNCFRSRSSITSIKKFKNSQKLRHKHGMLIETTMYRAYKCNCCKHKFNGSKQWTWQSASIQRQNTIDTDDDSDNERRIGVHHASLRRSRHAPPFIRQCDSSTDSDYVSPKNPTISPRSLPRSYVEQVCFKKSDDLCDKPWSNTHPRNRLADIVETYDITPSKTSAVIANLTNTAPSKATSKREAATKALAKLKKNGNLSDTDSFSIETQDKYSSDECNSTFEKDLEKAIALSLETKAQNHVTGKAFKKEDVCIDLVNCSTSSSDGVVLLSNTGSKPSTRHPNGYSKLHTAQGTTKICNRATEDTKENTFFANAENICNSTALNGAATCKQLLSRLPAISESTDAPSSTTLCPEPEYHKIWHDTQLNHDKTPKTATRCLTTVSKSSKLHAASMFNKQIQFKNIYNSTALNDIKAGKELKTPSSPQQGRTMPRVWVSEPKRRLKPRIISRGRKSSLGAANVSCVLKNSNAPKGLSTAEKVDKKQKPIRILLYKPQSKQQEPDGFFQVTKELLSGVIGEKKACSFLKHHLGRLSFPNTSAVYYCPPEEELSSSDSDDDPLQKVGRCGELYEEVLHDENGTI